MINDAAKEYYYKNIALNSIYDQYYTEVSYFLTKYVPSYNDYLKQISLKYFVLYVLPCLEAFKTSDLDDKKVIEYTKLHFMLSLYCRFFDDVIDKDRELNEIVDSSKMACLLSNKLLVEFKALFDEEDFVIPMFLSSIEEMYFEKSCFNSEQSYSINDLYMRVSPMFIVPELIFGKENSFYLGYKAYITYCLLHQDYKELMKDLVLSKSSSLIMLFPNKNSLDWASYSSFLDRSVKENLFLLVQNIFKNIGHLPFYRNLIESDAFKSS